MDHKVLTRHGYILNKNVIGINEVNKIKSELLMKPFIHPNFDFEEGDNQFEAYQEHGDLICVPRFYGVSNYGNPNRTLNIDGSRINIKFNGDLRPHQQDVVNQTIEHLKEKYGGLLSLYCGFGKTVIALYLASILGLKTLVVVHKSFLQDQWIERIEEFTNANVGIIRRQNVDIDGKDIVVGMLQSISMINYDSNIFDQFGLVIYDECHHLGAKVFSKSMFKTGARYLLGLSATPKRGDGMMELINYYLGNIILSRKRKGTNQVISFVFNYDSNHKLFGERKQRVNGKMCISASKMITNISKIQGRNQLITEIIDILIKMTNRKILVLTDRLEHLDTLKNMIDEIINKNDHNNSNKRTTSKYIGGMKDTILKHSAKADIIFATFKMAEEGLDINGLNTLVLASPKSDIEQSVGRIMRKPIKEGDVKPVIVDIYDGISIFDKWGLKRRAFYNEYNYNTKFYQLWNNKCVTLKEYLITKGIINKNDANPDVRKEYICYAEGDFEYQLEKRTNFVNDDIEKYNYEPNLNNILQKIDNI